ncbi:MAG TPA: retroviral-like aspartic protease family protein [Candidatus Obscuribacterales bacterium]
MRPVTARRKFEVVISAAFLACVTNAATANDARADAFSDGVKYFKEQRFRFALASFKYRLKENPSDYNALYYTGLTYQYLGDFGSARAAYKQLVAQFPSTPAAQNARLALSQLEPRRTSSPGAGANTTQGYSQGGGSHLPDYGSSSDNLPESTSVRYQKGGDEANPNQILVPGFVNNRGMTFLFDTGATNTVFGKQHLDQIGVRIPDNAPVHETKALGSNQPVRVRECTVNIKIGGIERNNFPVLVHDEFGMYPLLGQNFFREFQYMVDAPANLLRFVKRGTGGGSTQRVAQDRYTVPFTRLGNNMLVKAEVNGRKTQMFFDTGASSCCFTRDQARELNITIPEDAVDGVEMGAGGRTASKRFPIRSMRCGPIERNDFEIVVVNNASMDYPLLGQSFYQGWQFEVDNQNNIIKFVRR